VPIVLIYALTIKATLGPESLRILWQLLQGTVAGAVLLAGCILVFRKRAGVVLLHGGIGLLMLGELFVSRYAVEAQVFLGEGHTTNYVRDIRTTELAIIDPSGSETADQARQAAGICPEPEPAVRHRSARVSQKRRCP
jgi:cytochrome c biogenesis factor